MARDAAATNSKDKMYGVLGLVAADIKSNYSREVTFREVYHEARN